MGRTGCFVIFLPFNQLIAWVILAASAGMGLYHGVLTPLSLSYLLAIVALAGLRHHFREQRNLAVAFEGLVVAGCIALFLHLVPGIHNPLMIDGEKPARSARRSPCITTSTRRWCPSCCSPACPRCSEPIKRKKRRLGFLDCIDHQRTGAVAAGRGAGRFKIELHAPAWILPFVMANLFFVCMAEEALFRGYLQQRLSQWLGPGRR